jgi:N-acyl homoserine lactone hydrolase
MSEDPVGVEVDVLVVAELPIPHGYVFRPKLRNRLVQLTAAMRPGAQTVRCPCLAYVVRHPSAGAILIDTGVHPHASENLRKDFGNRMGLLFRNLKPAAVPYEEQLRRLGVDPTGAMRVVMTHLHVDHTGGMRLLPQARFIVSAREWAAATGRGAAGRGYAAQHLPSEGRLDIVDFDSDGEAYAPFAKTIDIVGDGSIRLISTPGHTPGHLSVWLRLATSQQVLVVGDAAYTLRSIREEVLPLFTISDELYLRSLRAISAFAEEDPHATLVPSHDPTAWHALPGLDDSPDRRAGAPPGPVRARTTSGSP